MSSEDKFVSETTGTLTALDYVKELQRIDLTTRTICDNNISSKETAESYEAVMKSHYVPARKFEEKYGLSLSVTDNARSARDRFYHTCKVRGIELEVEDE